MIQEYGSHQQKVLRKYGKKPGGGGGSGYDQWKGIEWAIKQAGGDDPTKMRAAMETTAGMGGIGFTSQQGEYSWSKTNHGGFPPGQGKLAQAMLKSDWPCFFPPPQGAQEEKKQFLCRRSPP